MYPDIKLLQATFQGLQSSLLQEEFSVVLEKDILLLPIKRTSFYLWNLSFAFHFDHKHLFQPLLEAKKWLKGNFWCWSFAGCQSKLGYFEKPMCEHKWTFGCGCEYHSLQCLSPLLKLSDKGQALLIITLVANIILTPLLFQDMCNTSLLHCLMDFRVVALWKRGKGNKIILLPFIWMPEDILRYFVTR